MIQTHHSKIKSGFFLPNLKKLHPTKPPSSDFFFLHCRKVFFSLTKITSMKLITYKMIQNRNNNILQNVNSPLPPISKLLWSAPWHVELRPALSSLLMNTSILDFATRSSWGFFCSKIHIDKPNS